MASPWFCLRWFWVWASPVFKIKSSSMLSSYFVLFRAHQNPPEQQTTKNLRKQVNKQKTAENADAKLFSFHGSFKIPQTFWNRFSTLSFTSFHGMCIKHTSSDPAELNVIKIHKNCIYLYIQSPCILNNKLWTLNTNLILSGKEL